MIRFFLVLCFILQVQFVAAEENSPVSVTPSSTDQSNQATNNLTIEEPSTELSEIPQKLTSEEYVRLAWAASATRNFEELDRLVKECLTNYGQEADLQQAQLVQFPIREKTRDYQALNDVATILFIRAEAYMNNGQTDKAVELFTTIIEQYKFAQAWDPRGWYWSVVEKSQASIDILTGKEQQAEEFKPVNVVRTFPYVHTKATEESVDYLKYGEFKNVGKEDYEYVINDIKGLAKAVGEGIYPNSASIYNNPRFKVVKEEGRLKGSHWDFVNTYDLEAAYFKWATAPEPWGTRLFYMGVIFERAGMFTEALRAYRALIIHFPNTIAWTYWQTPWYPADAAVAKIRHIIRMHPELGLDYKWMKVQVVNGYDNDVTNDKFVVFPGKVFKKNMLDQVKGKIGEEKVPLKNIKRRLGKGKVQLVEYANGHWQMLVDDKPYVIKGITYAPTKIGQSPDKGTLANWMEEDTNNNGKPDGPYDAWVDKNHNNVQDTDEPTVGDFQLMKDLGVNTMRIYHTPYSPKKEVMRDLFETYGIRVIMGDFLGKYAIGSGATWAEGTDYENPEQCKKMLEEIKKMVMEYKDEPYVLLWLLGNENVYGVASNADKKPEAFYKFANEVAKWIKSVDPDHPVAISNGDTLFIDVFAKAAPDIDIFTANVYRGDYGFGSYWDQVKSTIDRPTFITEFGCPAFAPQLNLDEAEKAQAEYHYGNWVDIEENLAGNARGIGNSLGGVVFEWTDEWWKNYEPFLHDKKSDAIGPFPGGYYFEEWFGITSQGNGSNSPFMRQLRKTYFVYKDLWKNLN